MNFPVFSQLAGRLVSSLLTANNKALPVMTGCARRLEPKVRPPDAPEPKVRIPAGERPAPVRR